MLKIMKKYHLRVYDNFHYGDESKAYDYSQFDTYELAFLTSINGQQLGYLFYLA